MTIIMLFKTFVAGDSTKKRMDVDPYMSCNHTSCQHLNCYQ